MEKSPFLQKHSVSIRIWHAFALLTILFIIITVLLNNSLFSTSQNQEMVQQVLKTKGIEVNNDQAWAVAHEYGEKLWDLHKYLGFFLVFLFISRIVIEINIANEEKLSTRIKNAILLKRENTVNKNTIMHYLIAKYSYAAFYLLVLFMATTGLLIAFGFDLGLSRSTRHFIKEIHGAGQFVMYTYILLHLSGVILADIKHSKGIVSGMINGGK